jgi:hypothetical protein
LNDWNADKQHHEALLKASFVEHVAGLHKDDIVDITAVDKSSRRLTAFDDISTVTEVPVECAVCEAYIQANNGDYTMQEQRVLLTKKLEIDITFNIRTQYFNRTEEMTTAEVYSIVTSRIDSSLSDILVDLQSNSTYFTTAVLISKKYSSVSTIISRSSQPTSSPSSQPTCGAGSYQIGSGCGLCAPGYYVDSLNAFHCTACPMDTYSSNVGSEQCTPCGRFTSNINEASSNCPHFALNASTFSYYSLCTFITILFLSALLFAGDNVYIMFMLGTHSLT